MSKCFLDSDLLSQNLNHFQRVKTFKYKRSLSTNRSSVQQLRVRKNTRHPLCHQPTYNYLPFNMIVWVSCTLRNITVYNLMFKDIIFSSRLYNVLSFSGELEVVTRNIFVRYNVYMLQFVLYNLQLYRKLRD